MADVLLFHHAQGLTDGVLAFAGELRAAGHTVRTPDLYEGQTFDDLDAGVAYADSVGMPAFVERGAAIAADLPADLVYAGFSLGALPAQDLAQTRPGARGGLLFHGGVPTSTFKPATWPAGVPLAMHLSEGDEWCELDVCQALAQEIDGAELFVYPGSGHLFADPASTDYDADSARLLTERTLAFLARV